MDINTLRAISTILMMIAFISVCLWAYSSKRKSAFDEAAQLPFADDNDLTKNTAAMSGSKSGHKGEKHE